MAEIKSTPSSFFFRGQFLHLLLLAILLLAVGLLVDLKPIQDGQCLGVTTKTWFILVLAVPIIHQIYVWLIWRSELCFGAVSRNLGPKGFLVYQVVFIPLLLARPLTMTLLAISDHDTIDIPITMREAMAHYCCCQV